MNGGESARDRPETRRRMDLSRRGPKSLNPVRPDSRGDELESNFPDSNFPSYWMDGRRKILSRQHRAFTGLPIPARLETKAFVLRAFVLRTFVSFVSCARAFTS